MLLGLVSFAGMPYSVLMPVFAESILSGGPTGLGLLMGASGLGALGGALALVVAAGRPRARTMGRRIVGGVRHRADRLLVLAYLLAVRRSCWFRSARR